MSKLGSYLALFGSLGTLICCALPAAMVALGMGAALVAILSAVPQLVWFSEHKGVVFIGAGLLLLAGFVSRVRSTSASCPTDPALAEVCQSAKRGTFTILLVATGIYCVGAFFAFVAS